MEDDREEGVAPSGLMLAPLDLSKHPTPSGDVPDRELARVTQC